MRLLIRGGRLITMDADHRIVDADIAVVGDRIAGIGKADDLIREHGDPDDVLDVPGRYVIPGLVNAHTHALQAAFRGLGDGLSIDDWQEQVLKPLDPQVSAEDAYWFTLVGCLESIRSGVTTAISWQSHPNDSNACRLTALAFGETGLRGLLVKTLSATDPKKDSPSDKAAVLDDTERVFGELHNSYQGLVRFCVGPPRASNFPPGWLQEIHAVAARHDSGFHIHAAGTASRAAAAAKSLGAREILYLDSLGVVDAHFQAAHSVALTPEEMQVLGKRGAHTIHCPVSNMYLAMGVADVPAQRAAGINVALGTDGPASNNNQDMFAVMKTASLLQKVTREDATLMPPGDVLEMATRNGAKAAAIEAGAIEIGLLADLAVVDLSAPHNQPLHRPVSALVYSALSSDVEAVVVGGRVVMRNRQILRVDQREIMRQATERVQAVLERSGQAQKLAPRWPWS